MFHERRLFDPFFNQIRDLINRRIERHILDDDLNYLKIGGDSLWTQGYVIIGLKTKDQIRKEIESAKEEI